MTEIWQSSFLHSIASSATASETGRNSPRSALSVVPFTSFPNLTIRGCSSVATAGSLSIALNVLPAGKPSTAETRKIRPAVSAGGVNAPAEPASALLIVPELRRLPFSVDPHDQIPLEKQRMAADPGQQPCHRGDNLFDYIAAETVIDVPQFLPSAYPSPDCTI